MPQNLPEQILQRIVKLCADGNCQREVARMLGMSQGCIRKILATQPRDRPTTSAEVWRFNENFHAMEEDCQLLRIVNMNRFISAPRLRMQMIRRFGRQMSVGTIRRWVLGTGYWSRRPARFPRLTLEHRRRCRGWGRRHIVWDPGQ